MTSGDDDDDRTQDEYPARGERRVLIVEDSPAMRELLRMAVKRVPDVVVTREPGGTELGRELREAIMHGGHVAPRAEALLYAADRAHHIHTVVAPALERGAVVVQDRYLDSSIVYQGGARGLGDEVERISLWATEQRVPTITIVSLPVTPVLPPVGRFSEGRPGRGHRSIGRGRLNRRP